MKAITLTQPWATLVAIGAKQIETRGWRTSYRGRLAIHAGKGLGPVGGGLGLMEQCRREPFRKTLLAAGILGTPALPRGAIVATCDLVDCREIVENQTQVDNYWRAFEGMRAMLPPEEPERSFGDYSAGRYAWILTNVRALPTPIPYKGALSLWEWET